MEKDLKLFAIGNRRKFTSICRIIIDGAPCETNSERKITVNWHDVSDRQADRLKVFPEPELPTHAGVDPVRCDKVHTRQTTPRIGNGWYLIFGVSERREARGETCVRAPDSG